MWVRERKRSKKWDRDRESEIEIEKKEERKKDKDEKNSERVWEREKRGRIKEIERYHINDLHSWSGIIPKVFYGSCLKPKLKQNPTSII